MDPTYMSRFKLYEIDWIPSNYQIVVMKQTKYPQHRTKKSGFKHSDFLNYANYFSKALKGKCGY